MMKYTMCTLAIVALVCSVPLTSYPCCQCLPHDTDGDGIPSDIDNCPDMSNPEQTNSDSDSHGDACDNCPYVDNEDQADSDGDGIGDVCEEPPGTNTIVLTGTVRDFMNTHPDFAHDPPENMYDPGIVDPALGMDGKPVYAGGTTGTTMNEELFNQWFRDVPGINQSKNHMITLDNTFTPDPCVYTFVDTTFFPIDGELFGNIPGYSHNYHFTFELHADLIYPCEDTCLTFGSDDDLWVFINNQLAIDLGGIHSFYTDTICLSDFDVMVGDTYSLDLFFAERHVTESGLRVDICTLNQLHATIESITPSPANEGDMVCFTGSAIPGEGSSITAYEWTSSIDGLLAETDYFCTTSLSEGTHTISFRAQQSDGLWSAEDTTTLVINALPASMSDLAIEWPDISFYNADGVKIVNPSLDDLITIKANVHNIGYSASDNNVLVNFYYDDGSTPIGTDSLSAIGSGGTGTAEIDWTVPNEEGYHIIKVEVEPDDNETYLANNISTHFIVIGTPAGEGDAWIELTQSLSSYTLCPGANLSVFGKAEYVWDDDTHLPVLGAHVSIEIIGQPGEWQTHTITNGNYSGTIQAPSTPGNYSIQVTVTDSTFTAAGTSSLTVSECADCLKDLTAYSWQILPAQGAVGKEETPKVHIRNNGTDPLVDSFNARYEITDPTGATVYSDEKTVVGGIGSTSGITQSFGKWTPAVEGYHDLKVTLDTGGVIDECNENNNVATRRIYVYPGAANLQPAHLGPTNAQICAGDSITLESKIRNVGGTDSVPTTVRFQVNGTEIPVPFDSTGGMGGESSVSASWVPPGPGIYDLCVIVDDPTISLDDELCAVLNVSETTPEADLWLKQITHPTLYIDIASVFTAEVKNLGCGPSSDGNEVIFKVNGSEIGRQSIGSLQHNGSTTAAVSYTFTMAGQYSVCAEVYDPLDPNNSNDQNCKTVVVNVQLPDLEVRSSDIDFSNANPVIGEEITIEATIHNVGVSTASEFLVTFYENEALEIGNQTISVPLAPGGQDRASVTWAPDTGDDYVIMVVVSPIVPGSDPNFNNNEATRAIEICAATYYRDADNDAYGNPADSVVACTPPQGYVTDNTDCDDGDASINPGATEVCDGIDNDCDGNTDEGCPTLYYDGDGDGYGNPAGPTTTIPQLRYVANSDDCDDADATINPGTIEICDGVDNDCDGDIDEGCGPPPTDEVEIRITEAYTSDGSMLEHSQFMPGQPIFYHIIYSLYGKPEKLYKVKGIVEAFGEKLVQKQKVEGGAGYHIIIEDKVPDNASGEYTIKYKLKMLKNGVLLDKEKIKSQIYVVE